MPFVTEYSLSGASIAGAGFAGGKVTGAIQARQLQQRDEALQAQQANQERNRQSAVDQILLRNKLQRDEFNMELTAANKQKMDQLQAEEASWKEAFDKGRISQEVFENGNIQLAQKRAGIDGAEKVEAQFPEGKGIGDRWETWDVGSDPDGPSDYVWVRDQNGIPQLKVDKTKLRAERAEKAAVQAEKDRIEEKKRIEKVQDRVLEIQDKQRDHVIAGMKDFEPETEEDPENPEKTKRIRREERELERLRLKLEALEFFPMNLGRPLGGRGDTRPSGEVAFPTTEEEFDALPVGAIFHDPDDPPGVNRRKGG